MKTDKFYDVIFFYVNGDSEIVAKFNKKYRAQEWVMMKHNKEEADGNRIEIRRGDTLIYLYDWNDELIEE